MRFAKARPLGSGISIVKNPPMVSSRTRIGIQRPSTGIYGKRYGQRPPTGVRLRGR